MLVRYECGRRKAVGPLGGGVSEAQGWFDDGQFSRVVEALEGRARTAREYALLGLALLRLSRLPEAEAALTRASILGDPEGQVELGNVLRLLGRFDDACAHFEAIGGSLTGELHLRALRWHGVAEFQAGSTEAGLKRCERAYFGYIAHGDDELTARVAQSLAQMHLLTGDHGRAKLLLNEAIRALPADPSPIPRLSALRSLLDLHLRQGDLAEARRTLVEARPLLGRADTSPRQRALFLGAEAEVWRLEGDELVYRDVLERLVTLADELQDHGLRVWTIARLAELHALHHRHGQALEVLLGYGLDPEEWPAELWAASGVLARRRGQYEQAQRDLGRAASVFRDAGRLPELARVLLHLGAAAWRGGQDEMTLEALKEGLALILRLRQISGFRPDLEELRELLHHALLEPDLAPLTEPLLDNLASLAGGPSLPEDGAMHLQVATLGRQTVLRDGAEVRFGHRGCVPLLAFIALHPGKTRAEMQLALWPDKEASTGAAYVRQAIKELRDQLGRQVVTFSGPHQSLRYHLGQEVRLDLDLKHFHDAVSRAEMARALALYRGPFLPDVEGDWAVQRWEEALLALVFELRTQMARYRDEGDHQRFILLANQLLRADPYNQEVLEARVAVARMVSPAGELARYVAELGRLHH